MANGYSAYDKINIAKLYKQIMAFNDNGHISFIHCTSEEFPFLHDLNAHYHILRNDNYKLAMEMTQ